MIRINLLTEKKGAKARKGVPAIAIAEGGASKSLVLAAVILSAIGFVAWRWFSLSHEKTVWIEKNAAADAELARLEEVRKKGEAYKEQRDLLERKVNLITDLKKNQAVPVHILDQISRNLPDFLWLEAMHESGNALTIRGKATNYNAVANFYNNLAASEWFQNVTQGAITEAPEGVTFSMTCDFTTEAVKAAAAKTTAAAPGAAPAPAGAARS